MAEIRVSAERTIGASASHVYRYLSDYRNHHHRFLPPAFSNYQVETGGVGAGTVLRVTVTVSGRKRNYHLRVTEPQPGRVLSEADLDSTTVTTFNVQPDGKNSLVRITTTWQSADGISGLFERLFAPRVLRSLYTNELNRLDTYAREQGVRREA